MACNATVLKKMDSQQHSTTTVFIATHNSMHRRQVL
uniref:Uncharacterized protein n=1 Tax=Ciona intestinalis TaxID=7719 RepID=H2XJV0_CIOIN